MKQWLRSRAFCLWMMPALGVFFGLIRYGLYDLHGMKQWPVELAVFTLVVLVVALLANKPRLSGCACGGYLLGFGIGALFQSRGLDAGGGSTNNLWILWAVSLLVCILLGVGLELWRSFHSKRQRV